jgi:hypothetical protein
VQGYPPARNEAKWMLVAEHTNRASWRFVAGKSSGKRVEAERMVAFMRRPKRGDDRGDEGALSTMLPHGRDRSS